MKREQNYIITDLIYSANDYFTINEKLVHSQKKRDSRQDFALIERKVWT